MKIVTLFRLFKKYRFYNGIFKNCKNELKNGKYFMYPDMRTICLKSDVPFYDEFFKKNSDAGGVSLNRLFNVCGGRVGKRHKDKHYSALYIANNNDPKREVKLFDRDNGLVKIVCVDRTSFQNALALRGKLGNSFDLVPLVESFEESNTIIEKMVFASKRPEESVALRTIADSVSRQPVRNKVRVSEIIEKTGKWYSQYPELETVVERVGVLKDCEIATCVQHGDLSSDNLIFGRVDKNEGFYWIDWEHVGERPFFYDYYFYILNSAIQHGNTQPYEAYLRDPSMTAALFDSFECAYDDELQEAWFLLFFLVFFSERLLPVGSAAAFRKYYDFIGRMLDE